MPETYKIKQGDLQRSLRFTLTDAAGTAVEGLNGAVTRKFSMRPAGDDTLKITDRAVTVVDEATAVVEIDLAGADTDTPGLFLGEIHVEWTAGEVQTYPVDGHIHIFIERDLAETPARTQARLRLELAAATRQDPELDAADVDAILDRARRADMDGRAPGATGWVETYDLTDATIEAWEAKAAAASCRTDLARGSLRLARQQVIDNCLRMAAVHKARRRGSAAMTAPHGRRVPAMLLVNGPDEYLDGVPGAAGRPGDDWGNEW